MEVFFSFLSRLDFLVKADIYLKTSSLSASLWSHKAQFHFWVWASVCHSCGGDPRSVIDQENTGTEQRSVLFQDNCHEISTSNHAVAKYSNIVVFFHTVIEIYCLIFKEIKGNNYTNNNQLKYTNTNLPLKLLTKNAI